MATPFVRGRVYVVQRGPARGLRRKGGFGWIPESVWPPTEEHRFLAAMSLGGKTVYDIGAFEGILTMAFARAVGSSGSVVAFEPNPVNLARIRENVALNRLDNVDLRPVALGRRRERRLLTFAEGQEGRGTLDATCRADALPESLARQVEVEIDSLDEYVSERTLPSPDLIKIDVEGLERDVLRGARRVLAESRPDLFIEIHADSPEAARADVGNLLTILTECGYAVRHVESGEAVSVEEHSVAGRGHLFCSALRSTPSDG